MKLVEDKRGVQRISQKDSWDNIAIFIDQFLIDKKAEGLTRNSIKFYQGKLKKFYEFCEGCAITQINQITSHDIRGFLLWLEETNLSNEGGRHAYYRSVKAFLRWYDLEYEPDNWKNPINKVKAPKVGLEPLEPVELESVQKLINTCSGKSFIDIRDHAIFLTLLDTGVRAMELLNIDIQDYNDLAGEILIKQGKGRKPRTVFIDRVTKRKIRKFLKIHPGGPALWVTKEGERLTYDGLRAILNRRAKKAGIESPTPHDFRRAFAINMLRNGADIFSLQRLMGHTSLAVLRRYLDQTNEDLAASHNRASPVKKLTQKGEM